MNWTTDKPTMPGYWWLFQESEDLGMEGSTMLVEVAMRHCPSPPQLCARVPGASFWYSLSDDRIFAGDLWLGPIEAPAAPSEKE